MNTFLLGLLGVLVALTLVCVSIYNRLVSLANRYVNAFSQIDVQLRRRYDLIPSLVATAREYMRHERETLVAVTKARAEAAQAADEAVATQGAPEAVRGLARAEGRLSSALTRLMLVVERYPDLKADASMAALSEEMTSTENRVAFARQAYNDAVTMYNTYRQSFPAVLLSGSLGYRDAEMLEYGLDEFREPPKVAF